MNQISSLELMPKPFDWIEIPTGQVTLGGSQWADGGYIHGPTVFGVLAYAIAKYPVTNAQYAKFIEADGYNQRKWWTKIGWKVRELESWQEPRWWENEKVDHADYPVMTVSWHEANAFCRWLSDTTGEDIKLPTEQQWQRAAQGDTHWVYPYGNEFDASRCNFNAENTTSVTLFEGKGDSPFGVVDMSGNVWEWCSTKYKANNNTPHGTDKKVLRGGSRRYDIKAFLRVDCRHCDEPEDFDFNVGFRIARNYV